MTPIDSDHEWTTTPVAPVDADDSLLGRLRLEDPLAYEDLVRTHGGRLLSVARRLLRNDEDARDALQDAFVLAFRGLPDFAGRCRLSTWLHRVVVNVVLMKLRSRQRKPETSIEDLLPGYLSDGHHAVQYQAWQIGPAASLLAQEQRAQVRAAIDRLPDAYRTVLLLRDIEEFDTPEVARMLGITPNAVKIRLHRARQALRTLLEPVFRTDSSPRRDTPCSSRARPLPAPCGPRQAALRHAADRVPTA